jgi:hypothetical protein
MLAHWKKISSGTYVGLLGHIIEIRNHFSCGIIGIKYRHTHWKCQPSSVILKMICFPRWNFCRLRWFIAETIR